MTRIETDIWPFIQARSYTPVSPPGSRVVRVIVIHDMEAPEVSSTAENIAAYFQQMPDHRQASAHVCVDNNSIVQCVHDNDVAYGAPGCNHDGIQIELAGFGSQTREQWLDGYGQELLENAASVVAQYCLKYDIPAVQLTNQQLADDERGIVGHDQVSAIYKMSDHTDPGPNFPWDDFIPRVIRHLTMRRVAHGLV